MKLKVLLLSTIFAAGANQVSAQYLNTDVFPNPHSVSNNGQVTGYNEQTGPYFIWNPETGNVENIGGVAPGNGFGGVASLSYDGKYISGSSMNNDQNNPLAEMSRYNTQTKQWQTLGGLNLGSGPSLSSGYYISGDGKTVVGLAYNTAKRAVGFSWNEKTGMQDLPTADANRNARANATSEDGSVIVGYRDYGGPWKSAIWRKGADGKYQENKFILIDPKGSETDQYNVLAEARAVSGDGKWIGGKSDFAFPNAWIWSEESGVIDLGTLTTDDGTTAWVTSFTYDGSTVLGYSITKADPYSSPIYRPWIWTKKDGMKDLNEYVKNVLKFDMQGDMIYVPTQISSNGKYIIGWTFPPVLTGKIKTFRIQMPNLATDEVKTTVDATLYPNPVNNILNIDAKEQITSISVYNLTGQQIFTKTINTKTSTVDMSAYKAGVYIVEVNSNANTKTYKVIKK